MNEQTLQCRALVVKIASRCNLNCTYCYMYNGGDQTYLQQPKVMSTLVMQQLVQRIRNHCVAHAIDTFTIVFHGGEPLLAGMDFFRTFVNRCHKELDDIIAIKFSVQTNGTLLTEEWCKLLAELKIHIGISLDGTEEQNDKHRIDHAGRGSYQQIVAGLKLAQQSPGARIPPGVLCVVDVNADPVATYKHFQYLGADNIDFLLPDANYTYPSPAYEGHLGFSEKTPYADWLIRIFDLWYGETENRVTVRFFRHIVQSILGKDIGSDIIGSQNNEVLVIETNGDIESVDVLKICGNGFTKNKSNVLHTELDEALKTPLARLYNLSHHHLCAKCRNCPVVETCGGGYLPHRYSAEQGFNNPSIYCNDLIKVITHIQNRVFEQLPDAFLAEAGVERLSYEEALQLRDSVNESEANEPVYINELLVQS